MKAEDAEPAAPKRVLVVDDGRDSGAGLRSLLDARPGLTVVGVSDSGSSAVEQAGDLQPDVVVLGLRLAQLAGHQVITGIRRQALRARIVVHIAPAAADSEMGGPVEGLVASDDTASLADLVEKVAHHDAREARTTLPNDLSSVPRARGFLRALWSGWQLDAGAAEAAVVTSELVTNAVVHGSTPFELRLSLYESALRISVVDTGPGMPDVRFLAEGSLGGRGLHIVAGLARVWGVDQLARGGKIVWAEMSLTAQEAS